MSDVSVVIVDDDPNPDAEIVAANLRRSGAQAEAITPDELSRAHLDQADLILVDYRLDKWTGPRDDSEVDRPPTKQMVATRPCDGLALAAVIRSQLPADHIRGIALLSANLTELVRDFSPSVTEHAAARINGLDWAFDKRPIDGLPELSERIMHFAEGVLDVRREWPADGDSVDREEVLRQLLALPSADWADVAARDVHASQPPINQLGAASHGLSVLRWLGQRILPYPTFLLDATRLAMACGIDPDALGGSLNATALETGFESLRYRGPLADFLGPRWWRAGVRRLVRDWTAESRPSSAMAAAVGERVGAQLPPLDPPSSVLCIDGALRQVGVAARELAVRVRPDDWPPFAETGWMAEQLLEDQPELMDLVDPADRARLES